KQPAVLFAADEPWIIRAEVDQEFAGAAAVGRAVRIQDDVNASISFQGRVASTSDWYLQRRLVLQEPTRYNDTRTIECIISIDGNHPPLRIGQRVRVFFGAKTS